MTSNLLSAPGLTLFGSDATDTLIGGEGDDTFVFSGDGSPLSPADTVLGGDGSDRLLLQASSVSVPALYRSSFGGIEEIVFLPASDKRYGYTGTSISSGFVFGNDVIAHGEQLRVDASRLVAGDKVYVKATSPGSIHYRAGNGADQVSGGYEDDIFLFDGTSLGASDKLWGDAGYNRLVLKGEHETIFSSPAIGCIQEIVLLGRTDTSFGARLGTAPSVYRLTFAEADAYGRPATLIITGTGLGIGETMTIDASAVSSQHIEVFAGAGADSIILGQGDDHADGGAGDDIISIADGGRDTVFAGSGNDTVLGGAALGRGDVLNLGSGTDRLVLQGSYNNLVLDDGSEGVAVHGIDLIELRSRIAPANDTLRTGYDPTYYSIYIDAGAAALGDGALTIDARSLGGDDQVALHAGGYGGELIYLGGRGYDGVTGTAGNDLFYFGAGTFGSDGVFAGDGVDTLKLHGDYTLTLHQQINDVERIELLSHADATFGGGRAAGYTYDLTFDSTSVVPLTQLLVSGSGLDKADRITVDALTYRAPIDIRGGAGNDVITGGQHSDDLFGGAGNDLISIAGGGVDQVSAGEGDDGIYLGAAFDGDRIDGGAGTDQLALQGYYQNVTLSGITGIETIVLLSGYDTRFENPLFAGAHYGLLAPDELGTAGGKMIVTTNMLRDDEYAQFDASADTDASYIFFGGKGRESFSGGAQSDGFYFGAGAFDYYDGVHGGGGADDQLGLQGDYRVFLETTNFSGVETLVLLSSTYKRLGGGADHPFSYDVKMGQTRYDDDATALTVNANTLIAGEALRFDASLNTRVTYTVFGGEGRDSITGGGRSDYLFGGAGNDVLHGGNGNDTLNGGDGDDTLFGGASADILIGGAGRDVFDFSDIEPSFGGTTRDLITDYDAAEDRIAIRRDVTTHRGADVENVELSEASFDWLMSAALHDRLDPGAVMVVRASVGTLAGHVFVVADQNGEAGFQPGQDLVIELSGGSNDLPPGLEFLVM